MKKDEFSFLAIFQDPLLTIIALVLLSTVWMIFPGESKPVDPKTYVILDEIDSLKKEIESMEEKIMWLEMDVQRLKEDIKWLESRIEEARGRLDEEEYEKNVEQINKKIASMKNELDRKKEELKRLEHNLKKAKEELAEAKDKDGTERILARIKELGREVERKKEEIEKKGEKLSRLEEIITKARQAAAKAKEKEGTHRKLVARLQNELKAILEEIKKLETELENIEPKAEMGGGFRPVFESNKRPFYIELVNNRLFPVDGDHYDIEHGYLKIEDGSMVQAVKKTRMSSVSGEDIKRIEVHPSDYHKVLQGLNPEEERIIFLVHEDSFEIFRKARTIALEKGIEIGWWPYENEAIILASGGGEGIGSTEGAPRPR